MRFSLNESSSQLKAKFQKLINQIKNYPAFAKAILQSI
ncbi:hypothetical protein DDD_2308 [Nonlabens dokdonensis DSW-6]|uniref:Uncharacterized protein n=1 Tax=Nonlabens dokdonensis (strain DSM 17205 / KCTC 12402 / DSW-6) TaxID=592029 RepID=L7W6X8_NONDD|nr:hypothetical protein DDD_2308 [Nonlabens dokdonensis DSW-6]